MAESAEIVGCANMLGSLLSWEGYGLDDQFVRISLNYTFRRVIERIEGEGDKKIMVGVSWNRHYWAIHYRTDMEMGRNILFLKENNTAKRDRSS